jgi:hypothetical protein
MQYITKTQHRTRYAGFPFGNPNAYLQKHHLEFNGLGSDFDVNSVTPDEFTALVDALDSTQFDAMPFDFTWDLNLTGTVLDIKFINATEENRIISHLSVNMSYLSQAAACTIWYVNDDLVNKSVRKDILNEDAPLTTVLQKDLVNSTVDSNGNILEFGRMGSFLGINTLVAFFVTKDNPTPDDIIVIIIRPVNSTDADYNTITPDMEFHSIPIEEGEGDNMVTVTGNLTKHTLDPLGAMFIKDLIPEIVVTSSTVSGDVVTVNFTTDSKISKIYLVQNSGYLPKVEVPVTNGAGTFKVVTTGMDPGDEVIVKMGYKYFINRSTFTKTL